MTMYVCVTHTYTITHSHTVLRFIDSFADSSLSDETTQEFGSHAVNMQHCVSNEFRT